MKIRIFKTLSDGVFTARVHTEDWSQNDTSAMVKYGEPEISLGGDIPLSIEDSSSSGDQTITLDDVHARIMSESPFVQKFDSRDYGGTDVARLLASTWASMIEKRIADAVVELRAKDDFFVTEEVTEY